MSIVWGPSAVTVRRPNFLRYGLSFRGWAISNGTLCCHSECNEESPRSRPARRCFALLSMTHCAKEIAMSGKILLAMTRLVTLSLGWLGGDPSLRSGWQHSKPSRVHFIEPANIAPSPPISAPFWTRKHRRQSVLLRMHFFEPTNTVGNQDCCGCIFLNPQTRRSRYEVYHHLAYLCEMQKFYPLTLKLLP